MNYQICGRDLQPKVITTMLPADGYVEAPIYGILIHGLALHSQKITTNDKWF